MSFDLGYLTFVKPRESKPNITRARAKRIPATIKDIQLASSKTTMIRQIPDNKKTANLRFMGSLFDRFLVLLMAAVTPGLVLGIAAGAKGTADAFEKGHPFSGEQFKRTFQDIGSPGHDRHPQFGCRASIKRIKGRIIGFGIRAMIVNSAVLKIDLQMGIFTNGRVFALTAAAQCHAVVLEDDFALGCLQDDIPDEIQGSILADNDGIAGGDLFHKSPIMTFEMECPGGADQTDFRHLVSAGFVGGDPRAFAGIKNMVQVIHTGGDMDTAVYGKDHIDVLALIGGQSVFHAWVLSLEGFLSL